MRGLYAIVDADSLAKVPIPLVDFAARVVAARPAAVQLRAKNASARDVLAWLLRLRDMTRASGVLLFANDRPDLARLAGADGVHVGQEDLEIDDVRRFAPELRVGVSTHDPEQLSRALARRPDYVAYGPVFATLSKVRPDPVVGLDGLARASVACRRSGVPLVAIGGIDLSRAAAVSEHAAMGAVISALVPRSGATPEGLADVAARARELHRALGGS
jgi:thiamine-phosphate pyrophosphorylase